MVSRWVLCLTISLVFASLLISSIDAASNLINKKQKKNGLLKSRIISDARNELIDTSDAIVPVKINKLIGIRGGDVIQGRKTKSLFKTVKDTLDNIKPATRVYLITCIFCTIVHLVGLPAPALFGLDITKIYEIWRPITSMTYLGGLSMSMANNLYFLVNYGQRLETEFGTGEHTWFLLVQTMILSVLGLVLGFPFHAQAMISAAVYVSSHIHPMEKMPFQFGFMITSWQLPFCMMAVDCLAQQNIGAAWPHVLGIFSGHVYHFFTKVWPSLGGKAMLKAPKVFIKKLGDKPASNVAGIDFRKNNENDNKNRRSYKSNLKGIKGKKLGSK